MKLLALIYVVLLSAGTDVAAQSTVTQPPRPAFSARLRKTLDAKKARVGESFRAELLDDLQYGSSEPRQIVPRGSKLIGHFTEAQPLTKESKQSRLGFVFDQALTKDGAEIPLDVAIVGFELPAPPPPPRSVRTISSGDNPTQRAAGPAVDPAGRAVTPSVMRSTPMLDAGELQADLRRLGNNGQNDRWHPLNGTSFPTGTAVLISEQGNVRLPKETLFYLKLAEASTH